MFEIRVAIGLDIVGENFEIHINVNTIQRDVQHQRDPISSIPVQGDPTRIPQSNPFLRKIFLVQDQVS